MNFLTTLSVSRPRMWSYLRPIETCFAWERSMGRPPIRRIFGSGAWQNYMLMSPSFWRLSNILFRIPRGLRNVCWQSPAVRASQDSTAIGFFLCLQLVRCRPSQGRYRTMTLSARPGFSELHRLRRDFARLPKMRLERSRQGGGRMRVG